MKQTKTRALVQEIEKVGGMRYSEIQHFLFNYDNVFHLRPIRKPSRGYWCTGINYLVASGVLLKSAEGKYTVPSGASDWKSFFDSEEIYFLKYGIEKKRKNNESKILHRK